MKMKVGINGFGRIGKNVLRAYFENGGKDAFGYEIVAVNNRKEAKTLAHLFKYDSVFGTYQGEVEAVGDDKLVIDGHEILLFEERDPANAPWGKLGVEIVIESTGKFNNKEDASKHIDAGAKKVILTAPGKNVDGTFVVGVNCHDYDPEKHHVISNASCTTNCLAPFAKVVDEKFGIVKGLMTTVHAYTNDQNILDKRHKDLRRARAAALSIIPTTTGAAKAVSLVLPQLEGKLNGFAMRVPTPTVSVVDLTVELSKEATVEEINKAFEEASKNELKGILGYSDEPLVSVDYTKDKRSSIVDGLSTMVMGKNMAKIVAWYDNEWGYSNRVLDLTKIVNEKK
ncbi:type I glyceraldehyde-3-phosphate dehydrogenase [Filifactor villosus]|uniref:Glyceraldehyde-3-phosphate dehydrogenase n=1 Tax=Filifactor villosus TaxID=29374 RepID=A0ABV9QKA5_9FIRM